MRQLQHQLLELVLTALKWQAAAQCWGVTYQQRGLVGAVVFDTFGYHVPAERMPNGLWRRRTNVGYVSNMAVAPGARRCVRTRTEAFLSTSCTCISADALDVQP